MSTLYILVNFFTAIENEKNTQVTVINKKEISSTTCNSLPFLITADLKNYETNFILS